MKRQNIRKGIAIGSFLLFPIIIFYFSPYIIIMGALEGIVVGSFIMFSLQFLLSLLFGRSPCGYVCPVGGLQECLMLVNDNKVKNRKANLIKYCLWIPWLITIAVLFVRAGGFLGFDFFFFIEHGVSLTQPYTYMIYFGVVLLVVVLALAIGKRAFCHFVCWMAPFMVIGTKVSDLLKIPKLHIVANKDNCIGCTKCSEKCPMSLDVKEMVESNKMKNTECILCGACIDNCPKSVIKYSYKR